MKQAQQLAVILSCLRGVVARVLLLAMPGKLHDVAVTCRQRVSEDVFIDYQITSPHSSAASAVNVPPDWIVPDHDAKDPAGRKNGTATPANGVPPPSIFRATGCYSQDLESFKVTRGRPCRTVMSLNGRDIRSVRGHFTCGVPLSPKISLLSDSRPIRLKVLHASFPTRR